MENLSIIIPTHITARNNTKITKLAAYCKNSAKKLSLFGFAIQEIKNQRKNQRKKSKKKWLRKSKKIEESS